MAGVAGVGVDTPFPWTKQIASHLEACARHGDFLAEGDQGQGRHPQPFHHMIDITPTT
jgi:hypothetical protein